MAEGYWSLQEDELEVAERAFQQVLDRDPNCQSARFNLASVWREQGPDGVKRAEREIRNLHTEDPDYLFTALAVALSEADKGNFDFSKQIMDKVVERTQLHISEAVMLFTTQAQIALIKDDLPAAEASWKTMCNFSSEDDPRVIQLRQKIDSHRLPQGC